MPLSLDALAQRVGVSKALIYTYFPTQHDLANALVRELLPRAASAEFGALALASDFDAAAAACAGAYFEHIAAHGPLLHILMSDLYCRDHIAADMIHLSGRVFGQLARRLRRASGFRARRSLAAVRLFAAMVEEAGSLSFRGISEGRLARRLCLELVAGGMDGLRSLPAETGRNVGSG